MKIFSGLGDIELASAVDRKFINTKYCKEYAEKYFKALCERCKAIESGS
ncbi:MAG: hypothetical protein IJW24_01640 [Clostridia bacterium]|nr:hypothetical protein [Clostridia bacterium]